MGQSREITHLVARIVAFLTISVAVAQAANVQKTPLLNASKTDSAAQAHAQSTGITVCDRFLARYGASISSNVPAAQVKALIDQTRKRWSDYAKNHRSSLASSCKEFIEQMDCAKNSSAREPRPRLF
jgi:hypothetical protein